ncbi:MAG: hypothetical protein Ct9H300mP22_5400 [Gammaproteobacteria bacterium]|nr:MAG: hypothetical protein Ct9H300mP22_5400 [Gammaproteobacteria bacterium]
MYSVVSAGSSGQGAEVLQPTDHCRDFSSSDIATFTDPNFEEVVRDALSINGEADLTCGLLGDLTQLAVGSESERVVYGALCDLRRRNHSKTWTESRTLPILEILRF